MTADKDKRVQNLFDVVQKKKAEIAKAEKPNWVTNCSFGYAKDSASNRVNVQIVSDPEDLISALSFLIDKEKSFDQAAKELGVEAQFKWMGYTVADWKTDFKTRINKLQITKKKAELESLEKRLDALVSPEMRAELELKAIEEALSL
jgi:hypothetical protein